MTSMITTGPMAQRRKVFGDLGKLGWVGIGVRWASGNWVHKGHKLLYWMRMGECSFVCFHGGPQIENLK